MYKGKRESEMAPQPIDITQNGRANGTLSLRLDWASRALRRAVEIVITRPIIPVREIRDHGVAV
jgi:hypothetical protein